MSLSIEGRNVPQPTYEYEVGRLVQSYKNALWQIQGELKNTNVTALRRAQAYALQESIRKKLKEVDAEALKWANKFIPDAAKNGVAASLVSLGLVGDYEEAKKIAHFNEANDKLIKSAVAYTGNDILAITQNMDASIQKTIREIAATALRENLVAGYGMRTIRDDMKQRINELQQKLVDSADVAIKDAAGRTWKVEHYTEMVARTTLHNVHTEAVTNDAVGRGAYYAIITTNPKTHDACRWHEGRIIKLDASAEGNFVTYEELKASGQIFHPNCKHHILPFRRFDRLSDSILTTAKRKEGEGRSAMELGSRNPQPTDVRRGREAYMKDFTVPKQQTQAKAIAAATGEPKKETILENYKAASTIKEANAWAAQHLPIAKVDYKGYDIRLANEMNRQLATLLDKYENVRNIKYIGNAQQRNKEMNKKLFEDYLARLKAIEGNAGVAEEALIKYAKKHAQKVQKIGSNNYASATNHTWGAFEGICWNADRAKDYDGLVRGITRDVSTKFHPVGTEEPTSVITHEFGHMVDYFVQKGSIDVYRKEVEPILNEIRSKGAEWTRDNLSQYAFTNNAEVIAEAFGEYYHSPNPRATAIRVVEAVNKAYNIVSKGRK